MLLGPLGMDIECIPVILLLLFSESRKGNERGGLCGRVWCLNKVELIFTVLIHTSGILTPLTPLSPSSSFASHPILQPFRSTLPVYHLLINLPVPFTPWYSLPPKSWRLIGLNFTSKCWIHLLWLLLSCFSLII